MSAAVEAVSSAIANSRPANNRRWAEDGTTLMKGRKNRPNNMNDILHI